MEKELQENHDMWAKGFMKHHERMKPLGHCNIGICTNSHRISFDPVLNDLFGRSAIQDSTLA